MPYFDPNRIRVAIKTESNDINKRCSLMKEYKTIFMSIPKAASASIKDSLTCGYELVTKDEILRKYMAYKKVTVVRNPFERLVSVFNYFTKKTHYDLKIDLSSFSAFIQAVYDMPDEISNCHYRSQVNLLSQDNIFLPDVVIDFSEIEKVKEYLPIDELSHNNHTRAEHGPCQDYYTPELIDLVNKRYTADLRQFNYGFEI